MGALPTATFVLTRGVVVVVVVVEVERTSPAAVGDESLERSTRAVTGLDPEGLARPVLLKLAVDGLARSTLREGRGACCCCAVAFPTRRERGGQRGREVRRTRGSRWHDHLGLVNAAELVEARQAWAGKEGSRAFAACLTIYRRLETDEGRGSEWCRVQCYTRGYAGERTTI